MKLIKPALLFLISSMLAANVLAQDWVWAPMQKLGDALPDFSVTAIDGSATTLSEVAGKNGTLLVFSRSTVW